MTTVLLVAWLCSLAPLASAAGTQAPKKPNIVFFLVGTRVTHAGPFP